MTDIYDVADVEALALDCLTRTGVSHFAAAAVARDVAMAEMAQDMESGFEGLLRDVRLIRYGRLRPDADITITYPSPAVLHVDAGHGFAAAALAHSLPELTTRTRSHGIALLELVNASPPGVMAGAMADLADAHLIGLSVRGAGEVHAIRPGDDLASALIPGGAADMVSALLYDAPPAADSPLDGPVANRAWLAAVDARHVATAAVFSKLPMQPTPQHSVQIAIAPELLAQIVNA